MCKLRTIGIVVAATGAMLWMLSLFNVWWISPDQSAQIALRRGCFSTWKCQSGDWNAFTTGLHAGGFDFVLVPHSYVPRFVLWERVIVPAQPPTPSTTANPITAKPITGVRLIVPLYLVIVGGVIIMAVGWLTQRRQRRLPPEYCELCRYDLRGSPQRCPECGHAQA